MPILKLCNQCAAVAVEGEKKCERHLEEWREHRAELNRQSKRRQRGKARKQRRERLLALYEHRCTAIHDDGKRCRVLGDANLEIHHVDGDNSNDHPRNTVPVCKPDHRLFAGRPRSAL